jgi:hypothetical protein
VIAQSMFCLKKQDSQLAFGATERPLAIRDPNPFLLEARPDESGIKAQLAPLVQPPFPENARTSQLAEYLQSAGIFVCGTGSCRNFRTFPEVIPAAPQPRQARPLGGPTERR